MHTEAKEVPVDDATMTVVDNPVNLPDKVQVVCAKHGTFIGWRNREDVQDIMEDLRFEGFEDSATGEYMLKYDPAGNDPITRETVDPFEFLKTIQDNLDTAIGADDPATMKLGVSYIDKSKRNYVLEIHLNRMKAAMDMMHPGIADALKGEMELVTEGEAEGEDLEFGGHAQRIVDFLRRKRNAQLQGP